ncbi:MAG: glycoside hydrolase family 3 C-terminal domain-containing protein [Anaerolineae bacterium]|nr:glycoside hydrolase family 3 C-terminal domain-containing protein [Anaerolineae bacterium]
MYKRIGFVWFLLIVLLTAPAAAQDILPYQNPDLSPDERAADLLSRMSIDEKIGQMTLVEKNSIRPNDITEMYIGGLLSGGGGYPRPNTAEAWADMVDGFQQKALETPLGIPLIYGADGVHGHSNVEGAVIFPHNIGLGATRNPELVQQVCAATASEMMATGVYWNYAPVLAVPQDIRWGRTYEGYAENTNLVSELATACIRGLQGESLDVLATPKHFVGDGGTAWGSSTTNDYMIDQGVTDVDEAILRTVHLPPYQAAIDSGALSIMISFSSWGGMKMHAQEYLITDVLKGELGFNGFIVSDWGGIDQITPDYYQAVVASINAGVDMNMVPYQYTVFIGTMKSAISAGDISMERIDDAVLRILRVKFVMGLFEQPLAERSLLEGVGSDTHRELARQAVTESLVLLKNDNEALPIAKDTPHIFVGGAAADDIGVQSGGWTIEWQGGSGSITEGTTILEAIKATVADPDAQVKFDRFGRFEDETDESGNPLIADIGIVVIGEEPYAEGPGDSNELVVTEAQQSLIDRVRASSEKLVIILLSGRPLVITEDLELADAFVAAWLPGTEGLGVTDALFGDKPFTGKLSFTWPRSMDQIPFDFANLPSEGEDAPLFPFGYGLGS